MELKKKGLYRLNITKKKNSSANVLHTKKEILKCMHVHRSLSNSYRFTETEVLNSKFGIANVLNVSTHSASL